ncbi:polyprenyl synthetase family protein [Enteractinococcus helveticum]|uniref:Geranylgeranyl pyrophosphate synthase n=1 Tax=Enteractinococcus helveticum TaxID=1837282 RepID=A0A1B7LVY4_9MICC|nr:polyprenyl synthetase family protein [Enteractinococcus helveticum]OAV59205.1 geranylgeranyl pyrophosphate synthase [Enteractinococcus helveticum]
MDISISLPPGIDALQKHEQLFDALLTSLSKIEEDLAEALVYADGLAQATTRHLLEAGGKRVRPIVTVLSSMLADENVASGLVDEPEKPIRQAAVALELTHLATLYHDDVMDEADQRRGVTAAHQQWSNSIAILAGDLIFARASAEMASLGTRAVKEHSITFEKLVLGQLWETVGPEAGDDPLQHYLRVIDGKTASLLAASALLGALLAGGSEELVEIAATYGGNVGMAFQLADDIIDLTSSSDTSGKVQGTDLKERVPTLPILLLREAAATGDDSAIKALELVDGPLDTDAQLSAAVDAVAAHPVIDRAWLLTQQWADKAIVALDGLQDSPVKTALADFARYVVSRDA